MSGYDAEAGVFEFTHKKLDSWFRRQDMPVGFKYSHYKTQAGLAMGLFRFLGYEAWVNRYGCLKVRAKPADCWEVLSGLPSDPDHAAWFENGEL